MVRLNLAGAMLLDDPALESHMNVFDHLEEQQDVKISLKRVKAAPVPLMLVSTNESAE